MTLHPKKITCPYCLGKCTEIGDVNTYDGEGKIIDTKLSIIECSYCNGHGEVYLLTVEMYEWVKSKGIKEVIDDNRSTENFRAN